MKKLNLFKTILFNEVMVKAILNLLKTNTRRAIEGISSEATFKYLGIDKTKGSTTYGRFGALFELPKREWFDDNHPMLKFVAAPYAIGEVLWVREPARVETFDGENIYYWYCASRDDMRSVVLPERFKPSIPKWVSKCQGVPNGCIKEMARIFLRVKEIRVEKLQDISLGDIFQEGCRVDINGEDFTTNLNLKAIFSAYEKEKEVLLLWVTLWDSINGKGAWKKNPFVWVIVFETVEKPENFLLEV